jgi:glucose-1-phosphate cytidylyltransferase
MREKIAILGAQLKAVLLAGGLGTRLREETEYRPKPMVEIGQRPILWHIMKNLSAQGLTQFVICLGYKGDAIKDYFLNYEARVNDVTVELGSKSLYSQHSNSQEENWVVTLANTGLSTMTGGRIHQIRKYVEQESFICTYGDGLADINLHELLAFHKSHGKIATVTAVMPTSRFGSMEIAADDRVTKFAEKPKGNSWVNGGFFVFEPEIFDYLTPDCVLENEPLEKLAEDNQLVAYKHNGFWRPMDTFRESIELNELWDNDKAPWKNW